MFDGIAYGKASDVLLMVENYLGEETFRKGVHAYLAAHHYSNATAEDFWNAQTATSHKPVDKIMESLVAQPGVPLMTFGEPANGKVSVAQRRFFLSPSIKPDPAQKWTLPVCFKTVRAARTARFLTPGLHAKVPAGGLFFANAGGKGYYRSAYPPSDYAALVADVETGLTPPSASACIGDEWAQVRANKATVGDYLDLVSRGQGRPQRRGCQRRSAASTQSTSSVAATQEEKAALAAWIRTTFAPEYAKLGPPSRERFAQHPRVARPALRRSRLLRQGPRRPRPGPPDRAEVSRRSGLGRSNAGPDCARHRRPQWRRRALRPACRRSTKPQPIPSFRKARCACSPSLRIQPWSSARSTTPSPARCATRTLPFSSPLPCRFDETRDQAWKYHQGQLGQGPGAVDHRTGRLLVGSTGSFCSADARDRREELLCHTQSRRRRYALKHAIERIDGCIELRALQEPI